MSWVSTCHISEVYTSVRHHNRTSEQQTKCLGVWGKDSKQYQTVTETEREREAQKAKRSDEISD